MPVQVFPPLTLEPRNITLIIGAKFQVQVFGGPQQQQDSTIEFLMSNTKIATSNTVGLITASTLGSTKLVGRVYGTDRTTSKRVVFSEDTVFVHVIKLEGIKIRAPVHLVQTGMELPLHAVGVDTDNQVGFFKYEMNK
jgi:nuclear pore complex protein Nup210